MQIKMWQLGRGGGGGGEILHLMDSTPHSQALGDGEVPAACTSLWLPSKNFRHKTTALVQEWATDRESSVAGGDAIFCGGDPT